MSSSPDIASSPISSACHVADRTPTTASSAAERSAGVDPRPSRPMPQRETRSSPSSSTATAAPAMAKSPWRRANSSMAKPMRPPHTGNRTAVRISSASSQVSHSPVKNSAAAICRVPASTPRPFARRAPARRRRTRRRDRRARSTRPACRGCGSGSGRCRASPASAAGPRGDFVVRADERVRCCRADPPVAVGVDALQLSDPRDVDQVLEDMSTASPASAPGSARLPGSSRRRRTRRAVLPPP